RDALAKSPRLAVINVDRAVSCVGHEELVEFRNVEYTLRFVQPLDALHYLGLEGVDYLHRIVAKSCENQQPAFGVCGEVIDATGDTRRGNSLNELQRCKFAGRRLRCCGRRWRRPGGPASGKQSGGSKRKEAQQSMEIFHTFPPVEWCLRDTDFRITDCILYSNISHTS